MSFAGDASDESHRARYGLARLISELGVLVPADTGGLMCWAEISKSCNQCKVFRTLDGGEKCSLWVTFRTVLCEKIVAMKQFDDARGIPQTKGDFHCV